MREYWNQRGLMWTEFQDTLDHTLQPLGEASFARLHPSPGDAVLDIGCGCGTTTLELARAVSPGRVLGVDLSRPMLERARARAAEAGVDNVEFVEADLHDHPLPPAGFDGLYSRFGTMFFAEPVTAFTNLRRALRPGGRLAFTCWRGLEDNPWAHEPRTAVAAIVPDAQPAPTEGPGPWSMADPDRISDILSRAGFVGVDITRHDEPIDIGEGQLDRAIEFYLNLLPTGYLAIEPDRRLLDRVKATLRAVLEPHVSDIGVMLGASCWIVSAR